MARQLRGNSYFLHDETTGDIVGFKDPDGSEVLFARAAHSGLFIDTTNQPYSTNPTVMTFGTPVLQNGITVADGSKVTVTRTSWYNFHLSVHVHNDDSNARFFEMWGRLNGNNIDNSRFIYSVPGSHGGASGTIIPSQNFLLNLTAGDFVQVVWTTDDTTDVTIAKHDAVAGANPKPAAPSLILTVNEIGYA
jgi:hypothetical protein